MIISKRIKWINKVNNERKRRDIYVKEFFYDIMLNGGGWISVFKVFLDLAPILTSPFII